MSYLSPAEAENQSQAHKLHVCKVFNFKSTLKFILLLVFSSEVPLKKPDQKPSPCRLQKPEWNEKTIEAPTAVTDKFPPEIYGDNLLKTLKQTFFLPKLREATQSRVQSVEMILLDNNFK